MSRSWPRAVAAPVGPGLGRARLAWAAGGLAVLVLGSLAVACGGGTPAGVADGGPEDVGGDAADGSGARPDDDLASDAGDAADVGPRNPCDDGDPCTLDLPFKDRCEHHAAPDGTVCAHDGDPCTWDACLAGVCQHVPRETG